LDQADQLRLTALFLNLFRLDAASRDTLSRPLTGLYPTIAGIGRKEGLDDDERRRRRQVKWRRRRDCVRDAILQTQLLHVHAYSFVHPRTLLTHRSDASLLHASLRHYLIRKSCCNFTDIIYLLGRGRTRYCGQRICMYVCLFVCFSAWLSARISQKSQSTSQQIFCTFTWSWFGLLLTNCAIRYVLPVL